MRFRAWSGQPCAGCLRYVIILIMLTACSSPAPLRPTTATASGQTATAAAITHPSPLATPGAAVASAPAGSPLQPAATETLASPPTIRLTIVDQSSIVDTSRAGWWSIKTLGPVGQTFRPEFAGLDAIELWTEDQWDADCSGVGARLQVNLREATLDGPLVGSSSPVVLPDCFKGITFFGFPSLLTLTPGKVYAIEVLLTSGDNWGVVWQQVPDAYPRGESLVLGASGRGDLWFQAGLRNLTPPTAAYCQNNLWQHVRRADGSTFKDQADCIQYLQAGQ